VRPATEPESHLFIQQILKYHFEPLGKMRPNTVKMKNMFESVEEYSFVMSNLLITECICDIQSRMARVVQKKTKPFQVFIASVEKTAKGQVELTMVPSIS
jgi:hypothetical protein